MTADRSLPVVRFGNMRIAHHASHSGYHLFADRVGRHVQGSDLGVTQVDTAAATSPLASLERKLLRRGGRPWYDEHALRIERDTVAALRSAQPSVVHLLWGESFYRWSGIPKRGAGRLLVTFHQPPGVLADVGPSVRLLRKLDGVMTLARNQTEFFSNLLGEDRVFQVPHGVDTEFFTPNIGARDDATCVVVGQWLRDSETLVGAAQLLSERAPEVKIKLVGSKHRDPRLEALGNVEFMPRLTDEELRDLYQQSSVMLLPLNDSTANCGLLEALATGMPLVCTDVGGVRDYANEQCAALVPRRDPGALVDTLLGVLGDSQRRLAMSSASASRSEDFAWDRIAEQAVAAYRALL